MSQIHEDEIFVVLSGRISAAINRTILRAFTKENIDLTTEQWTVMACLWNQDKVTQQSICDATAKDKPSITRLIDKLESRNLVVRVSDPGDRRINLIHLTKAGMNLQKRSTAIVKRVAELTLHDITEEELDFGRSLLRKALNNLQ